MSTTDLAGANVMRQSSDLEQAFAEAAQQLGFGDQFGGFMEAFNTAMAGMEIAEQLIEDMEKEHPDDADLIWHSFSLLRPTHDLMHKNELLYRSHCREILQRVIDGEDTRPGTAAECCIACCETSLQAPLNVAGVGVYMRLWEQAGLPALDVTREHHEALRGSQIDEHERMLRRKLAQSWRKQSRAVKHSPRCPFSRAQTGEGEIE